jgi:hypothetical protein
MWYKLNTMLHSIPPKHIYIYFTETCISPLIQSQDSRAQRQVEAAGASSSPGSRHCAISALAALPVLKVAVTPRNLKLVIAKLRH